MMTFEFLYYSLYRVFRLVKRVGVKDEDLATGFYSILLSTNAIMILLPLKFILEKGIFTPFPYNLLIKVILASIFVISYFTCKNYFIKKENYIRIINFYNIKYKTYFPVIVGIIYTTISFISFIILAMILSRIK